MPIYTYKCKDCKKKFDVIHGMNETLDKCEKCGSKNIVRLITYSPPIVFKGEGFTKERA